MVAGRSGRQDPHVLGIHEESVGEVGSRAAPKVCRDSQQAKEQEQPVEESAHSRRGSS